MSRQRVVVGALGALLLVSDPSSGAERRQGHVHAHGAAELNIVVEGKKIAVEFRTPAEGIMGFEHEAKTDADQKKRDAAIKDIKERFGEMVIFDKKLGCAFRAGEVLLVETDGADSKDPKGKKSADKKSGEHREVRATHSFSCNHDPAGSRVAFGVTKLFSGIQALKVQVLSGKKQSGTTIKKDKGSISL
jgi:hypothetical protein